MTEDKRNTIPNLHFLAISLLRRIFKVGRRDFEVLEGGELNLQPICSRTSHLQPVKLSGSTESVCTDGAGALPPVCAEFWRIEGVKRREVKIEGSNL